MFTLGGYILIIVFVLVLLYLLLLLPHPLINGIGIVYRANQPVFICYASISIKTTILTELVLWRRSIIVWGRASGASGIGCCGFKSGAVRSFYTDTVV
jgi:hypothetical protein